MYATVVKFGFARPEISKNAPQPPALPPKEELKEQVMVVKKMDAARKEQFVHDKIEAEIISYSSTDHHTALRAAAHDFRHTMSQSLEGSQVWMTGSFAAGVDTANSDLDFTIKVPSWTEGKPWEKLMKAKAVFQQCPLFEKAYVVKARTPVLQLVHAATGIEMDVTIDNDDAKRNTQLLSLYGQADSRFPILCKAVKGWAGPVGIECARAHRMNAFSICMLLIQYLQVVHVLPNLQEVFPELDGDHVVQNDDYVRRGMEEELKSKWAKYGENKSSLATLYLGFLEYYSSFDFSSNRVSIRHGGPQPKELTEEGRLAFGQRFIVVADPFMENHNCARSVSCQEYMDRIQQEFQKALQRILKHHTLFSHYPSPQRRRLEKEGMMSDRQFDLWHREGVRARLRELLNSLQMEELPWGSGTGDSEIWVTRPEVFWDVSHAKPVQYEKPEVWPFYEPIMVL